MSKPDGSVIIDTKLDTSGVEKGTKEVKEQLEGIGEDSKSAGEKAGGELANGFKKLAKTIAASAIIKEIVDIGKEAIELGSNLEEVQNVVDVTFTTMSNKVNKFAKDAKKTAGLSETMAKQYVGTFGAMAESFGFVEGEAYEMSTALTQLTGDVASFYNLSQDEAYTKLKSVFTGETESLKDLGVVMTQTALDAYAMANGFNKVTADMTEQEKVALRYQFVMDQLSAASGDFVRTQEGWANQSRMLTLQLESVMATMGTGLIQLLSPALEFINNSILPAIQDFADGFAAACEPSASEKLNQSLQSVQLTVDDLGKTYEESAVEIEKNAIRAEAYRKKLKQLEEGGLDTAKAQQEYQDVVKMLSEIYPELNLVIDEHTGLLTAASIAQLDNLEVMKEKALYAAAEEKYAGILEQQAAATLAVRDAEYALTDVQTQKADIIDRVTASTGRQLEELYTLYGLTQAENIALETGSEVANSMADSVTKLTDEEMALMEQLFSLTGQETQLNGSLDEGKRLVEQYDTELDIMLEKLGIIEEETAAAIPTQEDYTAAIEDTTAELTELKEGYSETYTSARDSLDSQIGLFDKLTVKSDLSAGRIIKNWKSQKTAFTEYKDNLQKAIDMGLDESLVKQLSDGSTQSMAILDEFVNGTKINVNDINAAWAGVSKSKDEVATVMADIQTDMSDKLSDLEGEVSDSWGDMSQVVRNEIKEMQTAINSLKGKTVTLTVNTKNKTSSASGSSGKQAVTNTPVPYAVENANVPYLASGAVIPPNAPFMAVLGDQRRGTNVEAPLTTIQEAVATVMQGQTDAILAGFDASVGIQKEILEAVLGIEIGDSVIGEAATRYNKRMAVARGWGV